MVDSTTQVINTVTSASDIVNSPIFIAIITAFFSIVGWLLNTLFSKIKEIDVRLDVNKDKVQALEFNSAEIVNIKDSIAGIGKRVGDVESQSLLHSSNYNQMSDMIKEMRSDAKEMAQMMADMMSKLNDISVKVAILTERSLNDGGHK